MSSVLASQLKRKSNCWIQPWPRQGKEPLLSMQMEMILQEVGVRLAFQIRPQKDMCRVSQLRESLRDMQLNQDPQQPDLHLTLGQVGVQLAQNAATSYETEMRTSLSSWSSSELRFLLHALDQCATLRAALDAESAEWKFELPDPDSTGQYEEQIEVTHEFTRAKAEFDTLRKPMFVLCHWSSLLTGSRDDARPTDAPPRLKALTEHWTADAWSGDSRALKTWHEIHTNETLPPAPFYLPLPSGSKWMFDIKGSGGVDVESFELRLAQLTSLLHECPWPFLTNSEYLFKQRRVGEC